MAVRIPWNAHEEAILLQALIMVSEHKIERRQAVSEVSRYLRKLAVTRGINIDEKFRNENGISLQMNRLEYALTSGKSGLHVTSGWYFDIVWKYNNARESYEELLREANVMSAISSDNKINFRKWLEGTRSAKEVSDTISSLCVLMLLLRKSKVLSDSLFKINNPDEIGNIAENIKKNKGIRLHSRRLRSAAINALYAYKEFLAPHETEVEPDTEEDNVLQTVSFTKRQDYSYTYPVSMEYFGKHYSVKNWAALYVQAAACLYRDNPDTILSLVSKNIGGRGRVDIADAAILPEMIAPKEFAAGLFLETNCSAVVIVDKIRRLMDICGVDYSNIVIQYAPRNSANASSLTAKDEEETSSTKSGTDFYIWLTKTEGLAAPTGRSYSSAINICDSFCAEHDIGTGRISGVESLDETAHNIELLTADAAFQDYNNTQHHRFTAALAKYQKFLERQGDIAVLRPAIQCVPAKKDISKDEMRRIKATLQLPRFEYGFKDDNVELYRFRASYAETNGMSCSLDDDILLNAIRNMGFEFDGKVYLISEDNMKTIMDEIMEYKNQGVNIIYDEQLYNLKSDEYFEAKIVSAEMLRAILKHLMPKFRYNGNYFALPLERQTEIGLIRNDIIRVWGKSTLQTFDELSMKLPLIPIDKIKFALAQQSAFVWNSAETYLQADWFEADAQEVKRLVDYIDEQCEEHGGVSIDEVPFENMKAANPDFSETAFITCFCRLTADRFDRNAKILTRKGAGKDTYTAVVEFCRKQDKCTYDQLEYIAKKVAGAVRQPKIVEAANAVMVRVNKENFIADKLIRFDVSRIDAALDHIVTDNFIGMKEITTFSIFPFCGYGWNRFLLESYCRRFSKKYKYDTRRANSSNSGAVVAKTCALTYHDIMAHAAARSGRDLNQEDVFDFLTEAGYIERKKYSDIDLLIDKAAELRKRRK